MGRAPEGDDYEYSNLWPGWVKKAMDGKPGQKVLRDMEAALLVMPEKRLVSSVLCTQDGDVCALGALAVHREMETGKTREEAVKAVYEKTTERWEFGEYGVSETAKAMNLTYTLAWEVMWANDDRFQQGGPEERYSKMLEWVRSKIKPAAAPAS